MCSSRTSKAARLMTGGVLQRNCLMSPAGLYWVAKSKGALCPNQPVRGCRTLPCQPGHVRLAHKRSILGRACITEDAGAGAEPWLSSNSCQDAVQPHWG